MLCRAILPVILSSLTAFDALEIQGSERSEHLTAREAIQSTGSDLIFIWTECERCNGYAANLSLWGASEERVITYRLNSTVTSLEVTDIPPRVIYQFILEEVSSHNSTLDASGRTSSHQAPPPVENLVVRPLSNSSLEAEWTSRSADGFLIRVLRKSNVFREETISRFIANSSIVIPDLEASTLYDLQVIAFYNPPDKASSSSLRSVKARTLPSELPVLELTWKNGSSFSISWTNPEWPIPIMHKFFCSNGSGSELNMTLTGSTEFVTLSLRETLNSKHMNCELETWFAPDERSKVSSQIRVGQRNSAVASIDYYYRELFLTEEYYPLWLNRHFFEKRAQLCDITTECRVKLNARVVLKKEEVNGVEFFTVTFALSNDSRELLKNQHLIQFEYILCIEKGNCDKAWQKVAHGHRRVTLDARDLRPWTTHAIHYRFTVEGGGRSTDGRHLHIYGASSNIGSLTIPALSGVLEPPSSIALAGFRLSWDYGESVPDYFLVTSCTKGACNCTSIGGDRRAIDLENRDARICFLDFVQAVKVQDGRVHVSAPAFSSWNSRRTNSSRRFSARLEEVGDTPVVLVHLADSDPHGAQAAHEHIISVCRRIAPRRKRVRGDEFLISGHSCNWTVTTETTFTVVREPWMQYEVSIVTCDGFSGTSDSEKLLLPVLRRNPGTVSKLSWDNDSESLRWEYGATLSGFSISICKQSDGRVERCSESETGPLDRQFLVNDFRAENMVALVTPFVIFELAIYRGSTSQVSLPMTQKPWSDAQPIWSDPMLRIDTGLCSPARRLGISPSYYSCS